MRLISRADLARLAGVSRPAITKACDGKILGAACQGDRVDLDHELVAAYLKKQGKKVPPVGAPRSTKRAARAPTPSRPPPSAPAGGADAAGTDPPKRGRGRPRNPPEDPTEKAGHMRPPPGVVEGSNQDLKQLSDGLLPYVERFGTDLRMGDWLEQIKNIELIREKRLKNGQTEGGLISRELVKTHIIGAVESAIKRLLGDAAKTIAAKTFNVFRSGGGLEEAQRATREEISKQIKPVKDKVARNLRHKADGPKK
ncbi:MAG TPA: hypothetical protein VJN18_32915 [Polyangiaceae bacterium]|nr:hypothetical protein [Polyangiaceae bacterium]